MHLRIKGTESNGTVQGALQVFVNSTSNDYRVRNENLKNSFKSTGSAEIDILLEMHNKRITGHLFGVAGMDSEYINRNDNDSINLLFLKSGTANQFFGVGTTYELWGVKK